MRRIKLNINIFLTVLLFITVGYYILFKYKEGLYSNNDINSAKDDIDNVISNDMSNLINDMQNIKNYKIDVNRSITNLSKKMPDDASGKTKSYMKRRKHRASNLQENLLEIKKALDNTLDSKIKIIKNLDIKKSDEMTLNEAIQLTNQQLKMLSRELSKIPE